MAFTSTKSYLDLVRACDNFPYDTNVALSLYTLFLPYDDRPHGYLLPSIVSKIPWIKSFSIDHQTRKIRLSDPFNGTDTAKSCTDAFVDVINTAITQDLFKCLGGRHSELYIIPGASYSGSPITIERFAAPLFGIIGRGAHLTMYTRSPSGLKIWVPRRSAHLYTYPSRLDSTVAGGVTASETPFENILHEADEEASLPAEFVRKHIHAAGVLTYIHVTGPGATGEHGLISPDTVYVYDMEVDDSVIPQPRDEEVKEFYLMTVDEIKQALIREEFKTNSAVVMIDFFVRHGIITMENESDYVEIVMGMHRKLPHAVSPKRDE